MSGRLPRSSLEPSGDPRPRRAAKRKVRVSAAFAGAPGTIETLEGPDERSMPLEVVTSGGQPFGGSGETRSSHGAPATFTS
ncbi:MAG: hypothetical protein ACRDXC_08490 [Acidimicrobiales bacterium]